MYFHQNLQHLADKRREWAVSFERILGAPKSDWEKLSPNVHQLLAVGELTGLSADVLLKVDLAQKEAIRSKDIAFLVVDIDGVMTDGGMYYTESGDEFKKFNTKDGLAIKRLTKAGFPMGIISSGFNVQLINKRAELLGIKRVYAGTAPKLGILESWCAEMGIALSQVAYMGDDLNDEPVVRAVGFAACPSDAAAPIQALAHVVLSKKGGEGCVRELIERYFWER